MVGVPGKYKGCETCRRRRVKCSNERPFCSKCVNSGRECEGYERERVFITGTMATKGRVASHPKKGPSAAGETRREEKQRKRSTSRSQTLTPPAVVAAAPLTSAWEDHITFSTQGSDYSSTMTALRTSLHDVERTPSTASSYDCADDQHFSVTLPPYSTQVLPSALDDFSDFSCEAQCLTNCEPPRDGVNELMDRYFVFLYDHNSSSKPSFLMSEKAQANAVRNHGPAYYKPFPNHHFFSRVYRPIAVSLAPKKLGRWGRLMAIQLSMALFTRNETFLSLPEWKTIPWEQHPKSTMDRLIDIALFVPSLLARSDRLLTETATVERQQRAKDLLQHCLAIEDHFDQWHMLAAQGSSEHPMSYWPETVSNSNLAMLPFPYTWAFKDVTTGTMFLYYWMTQILFHQCITTVYHITLETPIDSPFSDIWPQPLPTLVGDTPLDITRFHQTRELAANICRALDGVLSTTQQPDLLLAPVRVAADLYHELNALSQDAMIEVMWLDSFRDRLRTKGQQVADRLQSQRWSEVARFRETSSG